MYIGQSLDGFIATKDDSLEWLLTVDGDGIPLIAPTETEEKLILKGVRTFGQFVEVSYDRREKGL